MVNFKYAFNPAVDQHYWSRATLGDAREIGQLAYDHYATEISAFFTPSATSVEWNISKDIIDQTYNLFRAYVAVARSTVTGKIIAYCWATPDYAVWSPDPQTYIKMVHVDLTLPPKQRVRLVNQILDQVELFSIGSNIPVVVSTTMRDERDAFLKIHSQRGYTVRGSFCYIRLPIEN